LFRFPLAEHLNPKHELVLLGDAMDWSEIGRSFSAHFASTTGRPALPPRLVAGLLYLQHAYDCSDEIAVNTWVENPYWQFFTGETYLQIESPIDPSSLTRWRKRIGEEGVETMLMATIKAGRKLGLLEAASTDRVVVDTTVMPKAVAHPTDSRLLEKSRQHLVKLAEDNGLMLRQNYNREALTANCDANRALCARQAIPQDEAVVAHPKIEGRSRVSRHRPANGSDQ
jgi:IS5 family transposase